MIKNIIALILLTASVLLNLKHGWNTFSNKGDAQSLKMMQDLGLSTTTLPFFGLLTILAGVLLLIPKTFFLGNVLNAMSIVLIMALALRVGYLKMALIEIPFLAIPFIMIWLKYPFKN
jgi:uncharacterized membrane protein YphA (DoxX/SURF4 family)